LQVPKWPKLREISEDYLEHTAHWTLYDQVCASHNTQHDGIATAAERLEAEPAIHP